MPGVAVTKPAQRELLVDYAFKVGWAMTRHAPEPVAARVMEGAADRIWKQRGSGVTQLEANLRRAAPDLRPTELRDLTRAATHSYFRYWHEAFRLPSWTHSRIVDSVVTHNEQPLRDAFSKGGGAIVALPHMANWDHAGAWASLTGMPVTTVAERLRPESLFARFVAYREQLGMEVIPLTRAVSPMARMITALGGGRLVCLVADRDLTGQGEVVRLLDEPARLPLGPAALARRTGAPLFAATLCFSGPLMRIEFSDPIPVTKRRAGLVATTQRVADVFTAGIRAAPVDWHMLQTVFVADEQRRQPDPS
jgi:KDO2-lipid IV(A) lauroyltransferase